MNASYSTVVIDSAPLGLEEFARALGVDDPWVLRLIEVDIVHADAPRRAVEEWLFGSIELQRAREAIGLERDFDANPDTVALILDMQSELRRLKARLVAHGLAPWVGPNWVP